LKTKKILFFQIFFSLSLLGFGQSVSKVDIPRPSKFEKWTYHVSEFTLLGGSAADMVTMYQSITHPLFVHYYMPQYGVIAYTTEPGFFQEAGWAKIFGPRNAPAVIGANVLLDGGAFAASHFMYKKGGVWRKIATGLNFYKGGDHIMAGIKNERAIRAMEHYLVPPGATDVVWYNK